MRGLLLSGFAAGDCPAGDTFERGAADMTQDLDHSAMMRHVRDALVEQIAVLDRIGEPRIAAQLDACIQALNDRLGEPMSPEDVEQIKRNYFHN
jgi:hypothetical protein